MTQILIDGVPYFPRLPVKIKQMQIYDLIKIHRKNRKETLKEAASGIGISGAHLHYIENQRSEPSLTVTQKLLVYYGLSFDQIAPYEKRK